MTNLALAIGANQESLQRGVDFLDRMQRLVIETNQQSRGLLFLGMLFQFAFALFSDNIQTAFSSTKLLKKVIALFAEELG